MVAWHHAQVNGTRDADGVSLEVRLRTLALIFVPTLPSDPTRRDPITDLGDDAPTVQQVSQ